MYYLYILYSGTADKYYVGYSNNPGRRLQEHNFSDRITYTSKHRPWVLKAVFSCGEIEGEAMQIEKFIKKQKSRKLIERLISGEILTGVLTQLISVPQLRD
jgi:putative endonuclease